MVLLLRWGQCVPPTLCYPSTKTTRYHDLQFLNTNVKVESKVEPRTGDENPEGEFRCSCTLSLT